MLLMLLAPHAADAGSITYTFRPQVGQGGSLVADDAALARHELTTADVIAFAFQPFGGASELAPFAFAIGDDGIPTADGGMLRASRDINGLRYSLVVDFGAADFGPLNDAYYQISAPTGQGVNGYGRWTAAIQPSAIPEPRSLVPAILAAVAAGSCALLRRHYP